MSVCPCNPALAYADCCGLLHAGTAMAATAEVLMRSRYSAYALGGHGAYLQQTWHPATLPDITTASLDTAGTHWIGLDVLSSSQSGERGTVEFKARFLDASGNPQVHHEKSSFVREGGRWLYLEADGGEG